MPEIHAAGALLWRRDDDGAVRVALVHRPRYDDWSLPKGKQDPGETAPVTAVRELAEETGFSAVLGRYLRRVEYAMPTRGGGKAHKVVHFFAAEAVAGAFAPNEEVDELRWVLPRDAAPLLSHGTDVEVLRDFLALPLPLTTVLFVRHAKAGKRDQWTGDDDLRPLSEAGVRQALALRDFLRPFAPDRVFAAPKLRCVQTVRALAEELGTEVHHEPLLSEDGYWLDPASGVERLLTVAAEGGTPLVCSQGGVIPDVVRTLAAPEGLELARSKDDAVASKKGSVWLLSFAPGGTADDRADDRGNDTGGGNNGESGGSGDTAAPAPRLVAAHYFGSPLPAPDPAAS
jgi:8-oxo-dGTP pyrophosphatase MutT (NUDIX family)/phosphohistidine phosphatase SixA